MAFEDLQAWYASRCDGQWEHQFGIEIKTLDNPGWCIEIDLEGTGLENRADTFAVLEETANSDWIHGTATGGKVLIFCGPKNLTAAVSAFVDWANSDLVSDNLSEYK
ncbi:immunity 53 family protein [Radicibacter daui]|uniref:immunity 53 family protein n=1 Tax=Radicibacter daui TaxID=3064829 RepID=UPI004046F046